MRSPKKGKNRSENKPWAILRMTRRQWDMAKPWKKAGISKEKFVEFVLLLPDELVEKILENAQAERLIEEIFGKEALGDDSSEHAT